MASDHLMSKKKQMISLAFLLLLAGLTLFFISKSTKGLDLASTLAFFSTIPIPAWVASALLSLSVILVEGLALRYLCRRVGYRVPLRHAVFWASADFYISGITPLATGGQPAAAYFMKKDGVPLSVSSLLLVFNTMQYQLSLFALGVPCLAFLFFTGVKIDDPIARFMLIYGFVAMLALLFLCLLAMMRSSLIQKLGGLLIRLLAKIRIVKQKEKAIESLDHALSDYKEASRLIKTDRFATLVALLFNVLQRALGALPLCVLAVAFGASPMEFARLFALNILCVIGSASIPIPGTEGVAELIFALLFTPFFGAQTVFFMLFNRLIAFYLVIVSGGVATWIKMLKRS